MIEAEIKIKISNKNSIVYLLTEFGYCKDTAEYELDQYYNSTTYNLKSKDMALRIREHRLLSIDCETDDVGMIHNQNFLGECLSTESEAHPHFTLNYKGPKLDDKTMTREEVEFEIPSYEAGNALLNGLGFKAAGRVEKVRTHYTKDDITCCIDSVTGLGDFLEIEILTDEDKYQNALDRIETLLGELGYTMQDTVRKSYLSMLMD